MNYYKTDVSAKRQKSIPKKSTRHGNDTDTLRFHKHRLFVSHPPVPRKKTVLEIGPSKLLVQF